MAPGSVGICEDDHALRGVLRDTFAREGLEVRGASSGAEAIERFGDDPPDVLVLDIGLPDSDGRDVCQALRARGVQVPVLFLTARDALPDRLSGFTAGGDDYVTKPFALAEVVLRVQALLRRIEPAGAPEQGLTLDPGSHAIAHDGVSVPLTPTEFRLLAALAAAPGRVVRRRELVRAGWPDGAIVHDNTLDAYLARIRRKLREAGAPESIATQRGVGYVLR
jgi:two-component system, OmpR family, response regulator